MQALDGEKGREGWLVPSGGAMSVDHSSDAKPPTKDPLFLHVKAGMTVVVSEDEDWWMGDVIHKE